MWPQEIRFLENSTTKPSANSPSESPREQPALPIWTELRSKEQKLSYWGVCVPGFYVAWSGY